jgi:hypothetical protein
MKPACASAICKIFFPVGGTAMQHDQQAAVEGEVWRLGGLCCARLRPRVPDSGPTSGIFGLRRFHDRILRSEVVEPSETFSHLALGILVQVDGPDLSDLSV